MSVAKSKVAVARLAVFGNPIEHSLSPTIHRMFANQSGVKVHYDKVLVPTGDFARTARKFLEDGTGFNVTVPCKVDAYEFVEYLTDTAREAQAVNTVYRDLNGRVCGDNTDGKGLLRDITGNLGWQLEGRTILLIGAGGAVSGVLPSLLSAKPKEIHVYNRTHAKAAQLAKRLGSAGMVKAVKTADLFESYDMVINGTSAGLAGDGVALPGHIVDSDTRCYDMIYGANTTVFNSWCLDQADCVVADGLGMLVEQAGLAFQRWFDQRVETSSVIVDVRDSLKPLAQK